MIDKLTVTFIFGTEENPGHNMHHDEERILHRVEALLKEVHQTQGQHTQQLETIMTAVSDYAAAVKASFAAINTGLDGIEGDLQTLADKIAEMNNNPGPISPADQTLLDESQALANGLVSRVAAIDAKNPPIGAIELAGKYGLKVIAKNPGLMDGGSNTATAYLSNPNIYGMIVERGGGEPEYMDQLRHIAGKPDMPVWFVAFGPGRSWAKSMANAAKNYLCMGVTYSSRGEYENAVDVLMPKEKL